jgi:hypothetical protein
MYIAVPSDRAVSLSEYENRPLRTLYGVRMVGGFIRKNLVLTETAWQLTINVLAAEAPMRT